MNEFSLVCRILGSLFYRQPQDPVLAPLFSMIEQGKLQQSWPLEQDALLAHLQNAEPLPVLQNDFIAMFGPQGSVSPYRSDYAAGDEAQCRAYLQQVGMPLSEGPTDHFGLLVLTASWIEDHAAEDEIQAQLTLFDEYLFPWCGRFLGKVEAHATTQFYRTLAMVARGALQAMRDELDETENSLAAGDDK